MGILEAIGGLFGGAVSGVVDLARKAWDAAKSIYLFASGVFDLVGGAWDWMVNGLGWLGDNLIGSLARLLHLLEWLALHAIPEGLTWAISHAEHWAAGAIHTLGRFLEGLVHTIAHWTLGELRRLWSALTAEARRIWHTLTSVWNWIERTARHAVNLVLHPEALARWILASLVLPLLRFMIEASAPILAWLFKAFRREAVAFAHTLEDVIAKVI